MIQNSIFALGDWKLTVQNFMGSYIYTIENYYKRPDLVKKFFTTPLPPLWRGETKGTKNGCFYIDRRMQANVNDKQLEINLKKLSNLCGQKILGKDPRIVTNVTKFFKHSFNDIDNYYWWPHTDNNSYNCIIYLNHTPCDGTNLYEKIFDENKKTSEHQQPWQSKKNYKLICNIKSKYNKLVVFKSNIYHGLAYNEHKFKNKFRKNQVVFVD
jgi:hypothetical protein